MITGILLAAGKSKRYGSPKLLLDIKGEPLISRMVKTALASSLDQLIVVTGAFREQVEHEIKKYPVLQCENREWEKGLGSSIKEGIRCLQNTNADSTAALIMVADQPLLTASYLDQLIDQHRSNSNQVIASAYAETYGVPVIYPRSLFSEILGVSDDHGAKEIIFQHQDDLISIPFPAGKYDLDTRDDYEQIIGML